MRGSPGAYIGSLSTVMAGLSDLEDRKTIGVLWDIGTFWPRATHLVMRCRVTPSDKEQRVDIRATLDSSAMASQIVGPRWMGRGGGGAAGYAVREKWSGAECERTA